MARPTCPDPQELLDYASGRLKDERSELIAVHLQDCAPCQDTLNGVREPTDSLVASLSRQSPEDPYQRESKLQEVLARVEAFGAEPAFASEVKGHNDAPEQEELGKLGQYKLLAKLGQGGMGTVYKALHTLLDKIVAVKVLPSDRTKDAPAVARFQREMRAIGQLEHAHIVRAMDANNHAGTYYLVMEYLDGVSLSDLVDRLGPLPIASACELVRQAAIGLQHAHEHGLVHRDIKPSNLMLTTDGQLKILDLGLARLRGGQQKDLTTSGQMMGTIDYIAPEQTGDSHEVDIRADLFSLGATLYKLLCGRAPYSDPKYNTAVKKLAALANEPIPAIQSRRSEVSDELAAVLNKMLAKQRDDRFSTPNEVVAALQPFAESDGLVELVVSAREAKGSYVPKPPGTPSTDQHRSTAMTDTQSAARRAVSDAVCTEPLVEQPANEMLPLPEVAGAVEPSDPIHTPTTILPKVPPTPNPVPVGRIEAINVAASCQLADESPQAGSLWLRFYVGFLSSNTRRWLVALGLGFVLLASGILLRIKTPGGTIILEGDSAALEGAEVFVDDQKKITITTADDKQPVEISVDRDRGKLKVVKGGFETFVTNFEVKSRGKTPIKVRLEPLPPATGDKPSVPLAVNWLPGDADKALPGIIPRPASLPGLGRWQIETVAPRGFVEAVAWSSHGLIACANIRRDIRVYEAGSLRLLQVFRGHTGGVYELDWSPDGHKLCSVSNDGTARIWHVDGAVGQVLASHTAPLGSVQWSPDGKQLATASNDHTIRIWGEQGNSVRVLEGHSAPVTSVRWSPDGTQLLSGGSDATVRTWKIDGTPGLVLNGNGGQVNAVAWSPTGDRIASVSRDHTVRIWNADGSVVSARTLGAELRSMAWSRDGRRLAVAGGYDGTIQLLGQDGIDDVAIALKDDANAYCVAWSPDGIQLVSGGIQLRTWNLNGTLRTALKSHRREINDVAWSQDGQRLVTSARGGSMIWNADGSVRASLPHPFAEGYGVAWSPNSESFATGASDGILRLYDRDGARLKEIPTGGGANFSVSWNPKTNQLLCGHYFGGDSNITIWSPEGKRLSQIAGHADNMYSVAWSPDGNSFASSGIAADHAVRLWSADGTPGPVLMGHKDNVGRVTWSPDGTRLASASEGSDPTIRVWKADGTLERVIEGISNSTCLGWSPAGNQLLSTAFANANTPCLFNLDGKPAGDFVGHRNRLSSVSWNPAAPVIASGDRGNVVITWDAKTHEPLWIGVLLDGDTSATFSPAGQLLHGDSSLIEKEFVYIVEQPNGRQDLLKPSEFAVRIGQSLRSATPSAVVAPADNSDRHAASPARRLADFALKLGGTIQVVVGDGDGERRFDLSDMSALPVDDFKVARVTIRGKGLTDDRLGELSILLVPEAAANGFELLLHETAITDAGMAHLRRRRVEYLMIVKPGLSERGTMHLGAIEGLKRLTLDGPAVNDDALKHVGRLTALTYLFLTTISVTDDGLIHLRDLRNLNTVNFNGSRMTARGLERFVADHPQIVVLAIPGTGLGDEGLRICSTLKQLSRLHVDGPNTTDAGLLHLKQLRLETLILSDSAISDAGLQTIGELDDLRGLHLNFLKAKITDAGISHLTRLSHLVHLELADSGLTDTGLVHLKSFSELEVLNISDTNVTNAGVEHLMDFKKLRTLAIRNTKLTAAGVERLQQALPQCKIEH